MEEVFRKSFVKAMQKALVEVFEDPATRERIASALREALPKTNLPKKTVAEKSAELATYCVGALVADVALRAILEGNDPLSKAQRLLSDELIKSVGGYALEKLVSFTNISRALQQFGLERVEEIVEEVTTQDIYDTEGFSKASSELANMIKEAVKGA